MRRHAGHTLIEVLVALSLIAGALVGAATALAQATRWQTAARDHLDRLDAIRLEVASIQAHGCDAAVRSRPATPHLVTVDQRRIGALLRSVINVPDPRAPIAVTITMHCP